MCSPPPPVVYIHSSYIVDEQLNKQVVNDITLQGRGDALGLAITRNVCQGSCCVFNRSLMQYLKRMPRDFVCMHDWWTYLVCLAVGGKVITDARPLILYRQHAANVVGVERSILHRVLNRLKMIFGNTSHYRRDYCRMLLSLYTDVMSENSKKIVAMAAKYTNSFYAGLRLLFDKDFYSGTSYWYSFTFAFSVITRTL